MKYWMFVLILCILSAGGNAQNKDSIETEKSPTADFLLKRGYVFPEQKTITLRDTGNKWPDTVYYNTPYRAKLLGSPTIPFSFSRVEKDSTGKYVLSPTISIGYGYTWFFGKFYLNENDKIMVDPTFQFGLVGDVAIQNDFSLNRIAGLFAGGFIGFANFSIFGGFDFVNGSPLLGVGGRVDVYTFHQNSLKPIGKVREYRRHKKVAQRVLYE